MTALFSARKTVLELEKTFPALGLLKLSNSSSLPISFQHGLESTNHEVRSVIGLTHDDAGKLPTLVIFSPMHVVRGGKMNQDFGYLDLLELDDQSDLGDNVQVRLQMVGRDDYLAIISRQIVRSPLAEDLFLSLHYHLKRLDEVGEWAKSLNVPSLTPQELSDLARDFGVLNYRGND